MLARSALPAAVAGATPRWPAVLIQAGVDELLYLPTDSHWFGNPRLAGFPFQHDDVLLDSTGALYDVSSAADRSSPHSFKRRSSPLPLAAFSHLLRRHLSVQGHCCISKLELRDYDEGFTLLGRTGD